MNKKYTVIMLIVLLAVLIVSAVVVVHWLGNISADDISGALMEAGEQDAGGVALNSAFTLSFDSDISSAAVRRCLTVTPEIELGLHQGGSRRQVLVVPAQPLAADTLYTYTLSVGSTAMSWAFQTKSDVNVTAFSPEDKSAAASDHSISFTLDRLLYADLDSMADYFSITPQVEGSFSQQGRRISFDPVRELSPGQVYQVELRAGLPFSDTDCVLAQDVSFAFEIEDRSASWRLGGQNCYTSRHMPAFSVMADDGFELPGSVSLQLFSFAPEEYAELLCDVSASHPAWSHSFCRLSGCQLEAGVLVYSGVAQLENGGFTLPALVDAGCYLLRASINGISRDLPFCVSDLTAAALQHESGLLLWLHDSTSGEAIGGARVTDAISGGAAATDASGVALLSGLDSAAVCHIQYDDQHLILPLWQLEEAEEPGLTLWRYLYLSQDSYESGEELTFWGLVQPRDGSALEYDGVTVYLFDGEGQAVLRQYCPLDQGFFTDSITLPSLVDGVYRLAIWQSGRELVSRAFYMGQPGQDGSTDASSGQPTSPAVTLNARSYALGDSFAASSPNSHETLFLLSDGAALRWQVSSQGLYAGVFDPLNGLDSYCRAVSYNGGHTVYSSAGLYLSAPERKLAVDISENASDSVSDGVSDNSRAYAVTVSDSDGAPVSGAQVAVSVGGGLEGSPFDALYQDYGGSGWLDEEYQSDPTGGALGQCLYFAVLTTDGEGRAEAVLPELATAEECYLTVQATIAEGAPRAGSAEIRLDLPAPEEADQTEAEGDAEEEYFPACAELVENISYQGPGGNSLLLAVPPEKHRALALLGQALTGQDETAAAAAASVLVAYSGSMMEDLLAPCPFDLDNWPGEEEPELTTAALLALIQPKGVSAHALSKYFESAVSNCGADEDYAICLAALAALGKPQLNDVRLLAGEDLGCGGQCALTIAAALCGDYLAAAYMQDQPQSAEDWAAYALALSYCGRDGEALSAWARASELSQEKDLSLWQTALAAQLLGVGGSDHGFAGARVSMPQRSYNIRYSLNGSDYQNSFTSDSKYQLPLEGFEGELLIQETGGAGFVCFSVYPKQSS